MALVTGKILRGRVGDLIYYERNGKQCVRLNPDYVDNNSEIRRDNNKYFRSASKFSNAVLKVEAFAQRWRKLRSNQKNITNRVMKPNYNILKETGGEISRLKLVPDPKFFPAVLDHFSFTPDDISARFIIPAKWDLSSDVSIQGVIYLDEPSDPHLKEKEICIPFAGRNYGYTPGEPVEVTAALYSPHRESIREYTGRKVFFNLAFKKDNGEVAGFSEMMIR